MRNNLRVITNWGDERPNGRQELISRYMRDSEIFLQVLLGEKVPELIWIEFHGALANIPAMKNNRHPKRGGSTDPRIFARLKAMDRMFAKALHEQGLEPAQVNFNDEMIFIQIVTAASKYRSNEDNALTTIKDWLEPSTKRVGSKKKIEGQKRGWGIGLIEDDIQARGIALKCEDLSLTQSHTRIVIRPWQAVREATIRFVAETYMGEKCNS